MPAQPEPAWVAVQLKALSHYKNTHPLDGWEKLARLKRPAQIPYDPEAGQPATCRRQRR
jgi:hypothetical protein